MSRIRNGLRMTFGAVLAAIAIACQLPPAPDPGPAHTGAAWFEHRAAQLGISAAEARARDAALSTQTPPEGLAEDAALRREARAIWRDECARCHGTRGRRVDATDALPEGQAPPRDWGSASSGFAFVIAGDGFRATVYRRIAAGGDRDGNPTTMPAWEGRLAREQIWALAALIESF